MKCASIFLAAAAAFLPSAGYEISVCRYVANENGTIDVPVYLDSAAGLAYAGVSLRFDNEVIEPVKVEAGTLRTAMAEDFAAHAGKGYVNATIFGSMKTNVIEASGSIAVVTFAVRKGTAGRYTDIAVHDADLGDITGVRDVAAGSAIGAIHGMVRVIGQGADATRLEGAQTVACGTNAGKVEILEGDRIQTSMDGEPIVASGGISGSRQIFVEEPFGGWKTGVYALLTTPTEGLGFLLGNATRYEISETRDGGLSTYCATVQSKPEGMRGVQIIVR